MHVRRAKNGTPSVHPIRGDEICALRKLRRENSNELYAFVTERGGPMTGTDQTSLDVRAAGATPPGRGDFWILKITHAPSPKSVFKNGFCPRKGGAFLWKAFLQKKFSGSGEDSAVGACVSCSYALVAEGYKEPSASQ